MQNENVDFLTVVLKYGLLVMLIMAIIFVLAVLTPWMAKQVDQLLARVKNKKNSAQGAADPRCAQIKSIYDVQAALPEDTSQEEQMSSDDEAATDINDRKEQV